MKEQNYFSKKLTGGAINQRGVKYQIYVCIKYIFDFLDDTTFRSILIEQDDDFTIDKGNEKILCQVKSTCYDMNNVKKILGGYCDRKRNLICSAFTDDVKNLIYKKEWYENKRNSALCDEENILKEYKYEIEKNHIKYEDFNNTKLVTISYDYAKEIAKSAIFEWKKKNNMSLDIDKLFDVLYHEISILGSSRGSLSKNRIYEIIEQCIDRENTISTSLDIMENKDFFNEEDIPQERWINYIQKSEDNIFSIIPKLQYWEDILLMHKPMNPLFYEIEPFKWDLPNFDIKVLNNSDTSLFLTEIIFEVKTSTLNPSPLIFIVGCGSEMRARHIELSNDGWGEIRNLKMKINCDTKFNENFDEFTAEEYIGNFLTDKKVDLTNMLHKITKIDFENFDCEYNKPYNNGEYKIYCEQLLKKYFGKYSSGKAFVNGILEFDADTIEKENRHFTLKFSSWINLYENTLAGAFVEPSSQYYIELPVEGSNYVIRKSISQELHPSKADRFNLKIYCEKSSAHVLNIYLKDISGKKIEVKKNVHLNICIPRSGSKYIIPKR